MKDEALKLALEKVANALPAYIEGTPAREYLAVIHSALAAPVQQPHKGLSEHMAQALRGMVRIDPVTGDVGIGTIPAQPAPVREDWGPGPHEYHSLPPAAQPAQPASVPDVDWKDQYEKQKRRSEMWVAKYEKDIGPLEKAVPAAQRKPLTKWQAQDIVELESWGPDAIALNAQLMRTIRRTEAAHDIKENT